MFGVVAIVVLSSPCASCVTTAHELGMTAVWGGTFWRSVIGHPAGHLNFEF